jgi:hypothetical protein
MAAATKAAAAKAAAAAVEAEVDKYVDTLDSMTMSDRKNPVAIRAMAIEAGFIMCGTAKVLLRCMPGPQFSIDKLWELVSKQLEAAGFPLDSREADYCFHMLETCRDNSVPWRVHHCRFFGISLDENGNIPRGVFTHNGDFPEFTTILEPLKALSNCKTPVIIARNSTGGGTSSRGTATPTTGRSSRKRSS